MKNSFIREIETLKSQEELLYKKEWYLDYLIDLKEIDDMFGDVEINNVKYYLELIEKRLEEYK